MIYDMFMGYKSTKKGVINNYVKWNNEMIWILSLDLTQSRNKRNVIPYCLLFFFFPFTNTLIQSKVK